jgi:multiple sugar transport system substrate-binding protein
MGQSGRKYVLTEAHDYNTVAYTVYEHMSRRLRMRRALSLLMCTLLLLSAGFLYSAAKIRIVHFHWTQPPYDEINLASAQSFMAANPNVEVKVLFFRDPDMVTKVRTTLAASSELDTFAMQGKLSPWFMSMGVVEEIIPSAFDKRTVDEVVDLWKPGVMKKCGGFWQGKYYGIPFELSSYVAWINTAQMREAGLNPEKDIPKTWDQFTAVCKKMTVDKGGVRVRNGTAVNLKPASFPHNIFLALATQKGLDWTTEESLVKSLDSKEIVEALSTFTNWALKDDIFSPGLFDDERQGFGNGQTATFLTGGSWYWGVLDGYSVPRADVTPFPYPRFRGGQDTGGYAYGYSAFVAKQTKNKEWSWRWLNHLASFPDKFIEYGYWQPRKTLSGELAAKYIPKNEVFETERLKGAGHLLSPKFNEVQDEITNSVTRVIFQKITPEESIAILKQNVKAILGK